MDKKSPAGLRIELVGERDKLQILIGFSIEGGGEGGILLAPRQAALIASYLLEAIDEAERRSRLSE
jgi:hypothetical protein